MIVQSVLRALWTNYSRVSYVQVLVLDGLFAMILLFLGVDAQSIGR